MPIILPNALTTPEIRVLQEFSRLNAETLPLDTIKAIKHPAGGGETPAAGLVEKDYLSADGTRENFALTQKAKDFLAIDAKPMFEETSTAGSAAENADEEAV